jgi:cytochrome c biogenesis protein CcdA
MADSVLAVAGLVVTIGLADAMNPSTVGPASALAIQPDGARRAAAFTAGVAGTSLAAGLVLVAGPGAAIMAALPHPGPRVRDLAEIALGVVLLALALAAWLGRHRLARALAAPEEGRTRRAGLAAPLGVGAAIMAVELPTAFPYFGALAAIVGSKAPLPTQLLLVVAFNAAFVLPLLAIVAVRIAAGERGGGRLERFRLVLARYAGIVLAGLLAVAGLVLVGLGLSGLIPIG